MPETDVVVAMYSTYGQAANSIPRLQDAGVSLGSLSIAARDPQTEQHGIRYDNTGERTKYWGRNGEFWEGLWGLLPGSGLLIIPGVGPILVADPLMAWIIAGLELAAQNGGVSALGLAFASIGTPEDGFIDYETALKMDKFLFIVHGPTEEVSRARGLLQNDGYHVAYTSHDEKVMAR